MKEKIKNNKKILLILGCIIIILSLVTIPFSKKHITKILKKDDLINISNLSEDFMENYFEETSEIKEEDKKNILIVISEKKIKNTYGAFNVIEAPNNQYMLQYDSEKAKNNALEKLKKDKTIESVEENAIYTSDEVSYNSWGIEKMDLDYAKTSINLETAEDVTVAIIDGGCDMELFNKYYSGKIVETYDVLEESTTSMTDERGHGTHIAGTIAEATPDNVKILPIKVTKDGFFHATDVIAAINYIVTYKKADVINMSFGNNGYGEALFQAIEAANINNIISVAGAGNDNSSKEFYPSGYDNTISISAVDSTLNKSDFSNYGSTITFTAPGTDILSINGVKSGTSMAAPHAASAVAILKSYNKNLTLTNVVDLLKKSSIDLGEEGWDQYYGHGLISFKDVEFCDKTICDKYGVYKDLSKYITNMEVTEMKFTKYNYYSALNLMGSKVNVSYIDGTNEELILGKIPMLEIINYNPTTIASQTITIKIDDATIDVEVINPDNYEDGWEYNILSDGTIEITGYKNHGLGIENLYIPETIDSKQVVSFADNVRFKELGTDFESYTYLYLPTSFTKIGDYTFSETKIKYVYGTSEGVEIGNHAFESSSIVNFDVPITKVGDYAFKDCFELLYVDIPGKFTGTDASDNELAETYIGEYAFYNCKKLKKVSSSKYELVSVTRIGKYAFYNCEALTRLDLKPVCDIEEYAFYQTPLLANLELIDSGSIGKYAFYGSGISKADLGSNLDLVSESAFENCINLKEVSIERGRIETKAFWNSNTEIISITSDVEYIAEDSFAYTPMKTSGKYSTGGNIYASEPGVGIIEKATNKLIIGFTDASGASNVKIPDYVTEIGEYAFTGNRNLKKITIPANVTKIGKNSFKDCYQLSDVYMLGDSISFEIDTFKRIDEEIKAEELMLYAYKDSDIKQYIRSKNLQYRHIDPDEIIVINEKTTYKAHEMVNDADVAVKLIYNEEETREEILTSRVHSVGPISNGVGFIINYQNSYNFLYGDTYYIVKAKNILGYEISTTVDVTIEKATPSYTMPTNLTAKVGQKLSEITLPNGFEWLDPEQVIEKTGKQKYLAKFTPTDLENYLIVENIEITISVKATPSYTIPTNLTAEVGQKLSEVTLSDGFEWMNPEQVIEKTGEQNYLAKFTPTDTDNYEIVENIEITISVKTNKEIIIPDIELSKKEYDGTNSIDTDNISITNLNNTDYTIIDAKTTAIDAGKTTAEITIKLSDEKFGEYTLENGKQENNYIVDIEITPKALKKPSVIEATYTYDGERHYVQLNDFDDTKMKVTGDERIDAGEHDVIVSLTDSNYMWEDNTTTDITLKFKIEKAMIEYSSSSNIVDYDGNMHGINLTIEKPSNAIVKYMDENEEYTLDEMPKYKEIGEYTIKYKIIADNNYNIVTDEAKVIIRKKDDTSSTIDYEGYYDGLEHSINISEDITGCELKYSLDNENYNLTELPKFKNPGEYTIYYTINCGAAGSAGSGTVKIYGIEEFDSTIKVKDDIIITKNNSFSNLTDKIKTYSISTTYNHYDKNNSLVSTDIIKTGDIININLNNFKDYKYSISILGDVNSDGKISSADYVKIRKHIMEAEIIKDNLYFYSADVNSDDKISSADYVKIRKYIMNGESL